MMPCLKPLKTNELSFGMRINFRGDEGVLLDVNLHRTECTVATEACNSVAICSPSLLFATRHPDDALYLFQDVGKKLEQIGYERLGDFVKGNLIRNGQPTDEFDLTAADIVIIIDEVDTDICGVYIKK